MAKKKRTAKASVAKKARAKASVPKSARKARVPRQKVEANSDPSAAAGRSGATVRVYRQGLGDCILVTLPRQDGTDFRLMIDCGVAVATQNATDKMKDVLEDIVETVKNNKIDALAITHEHWDHVSGFQQASDVFERLPVDEVWLAWTEDSKDELAKTLKKDHQRAFALLSRGAAVRAMSGDASGAGSLLNIAGMLGAAGEKTKAALDIVKRKVDDSKTRYLRPDVTEPILVPGTGATIYVLGPPHDEKAIKHFNPSKRNPEVYELALDGTGLLAAGVYTALAEPADVRPFADSSSIPLEAARSMPFFQHHYWGTPGDASEWRRIDSDWLGGTDEFALMLQSATNNTSLVLAIELQSGDVMLFAGDAQVGNWLSWQSLSWKHPDGRTVTGPDLLARTVFYKVGHHGSHNATLRQQGLELMKRLETAVIPVDEAVAKKMRWAAMPLAGLVKALKDQTSGKTFRTDDEGLTANVGPRPKLYLEFEI
ncbi:MBL fold metallo-hydrolase [Bradyrhizobium sp. WSM2254]|uniref:MBL fold metallo-hydrolase n=1 Tax=Bradyrhizobium sp. WSM2254 TaxID=1188263 RepID=UPI000415E5A4|nr:MBL fold metallo-hydrolase [Bradyrhizobium sp. WSM2254]